MREYARCVRITYDRLIDDESRDYYCPVEQLVDYAMRNNMIDASLRDIAEGLVRYVTETDVYVTSIENVRGVE